MNVASKLKDPLPHPTDPFALAGTRASLNAMGLEQNRRFTAVSEITGKGKLAKSSKAGKNLSRRGSATQILQMFLYELIGTL